MDAHVQQSLVEALRRRGWDVVRAIEVFPEKTDDEVHFEYAAGAGRVFVTNDGPLQGIANRWLREGRRFSGMITWPQRRYQEKTTGDFVEDFKELAEREDPFGRYPIIYL
jgi:hypothetical protein